MTCIVLVQNPKSGGVLAITEDDEEISRWPTVEAARETTEGLTLVRAWGGYIVDLENMEVLEI